MNLHQDHHSYLSQRMNMIKIAFVVCCAAFAAAEAEADAGLLYGAYGYGAGLGYAGLGYGYSGLGYAGYGYNRLGYPGLGYPGLGYYGKRSADAGRYYGGYGKAGPWGAYTGITGGAPATTPAPTGGHNTVPLSFINGQFVY